MPLTEQQLGMVWKMPPGFKPANGKVPTPDEFRAYGKLVPASSLSPKPQTDNAGGRVLPHTPSRGLPMSRPTLPDTHVWGFKPGFVPPKDRPPTDEELREYGVPIEIASLPAATQARIKAAEINARKLTPAHRSQCDCKSCQQWRADNNIPEAGGK